MGKWETQSYTDSIGDNATIFASGINPFGKAISLRMSSRTHIELGIQFLLKRFPKFTNKAGISFWNNDFRNALKYTTIVNKDIYRFFIGDLFFMTRDKVSHFKEWHTKIKIAMYCNLELLGNSVTKSMPTISHGYSRTPRGTRTRSLAGSVSHDCKQHNFRSDFCN